MKNIGVIGAGSWGTALAKLLYKNGHKVTLWTFLESQAKSIIADGENKEFLPDIKIPKDLVVTNSEEEAVKGKDMLIIAVPSKFIRDNIKNIKPFITDNQVIVIVSKGFEDTTLLTLTEVVQGELPNNKIAALSGPSHAEEVSRELPTTCVAACEDYKVAAYIQDVFMNETFRVYTNTDVLGVELGGALKNVIALAAGIGDGLGFGDNSKAALMTRGLTEIAKLGVKMGANKNTFTGLTGLGDLIVTCTSLHSRNMRAGRLIGQGMNLDEVLEEIHMVVEGVSNANAAYHLSQKYGVDMPIINEVYKVVFENKSPRLAVNELMTREKTSEETKETKMSGWDFTEI